MWYACTHSTHGQRASRGCVQFAERKIMAWLGSCRKPPVMSYMPLTLPGKHEHSEVTMVGHRHRSAAGNEQRHALPSAGMAAMLSSLPHLPCLLPSCFPYGTAFKWERCSPYTTTFRHCHSQIIIVQYSHLDPTYRKQLHANWLHLSNILPLHPHIHSKVTLHLICSICKMSWVNYGLW